MSTLLVYAPATTHTKPHHPENHGRFSTVLPTLSQFNVLADLTAVEPQAATEAQLQRTHSQRLINYVREVSSRGGGLLDRGDTYATPESYDLARLAAGGCCEAVDLIMSGRARNGMALVRPPGHHAEIDRAGGFCLFNNAAIAARQAQAVHGAQRVLILDFDVHHGNGTQDIFYEDQSVMFASIHLFIPYYFYPGVGSSHEMGNGPGRGYTINVPLPPHVGDLGYDRILKELILPRAASFQPDLIIVSAGFDAHWRDPLAMAGLSLTGYARMARTIVEMANRLCDGRVLFVLEGGYLQEALTFGILNAIYALLGRDEIQDPLGPMPQAEYDVTELLDQLKQRHLRY